MDNEKDFCHFGKEVGKILSFEEFSQPYANSNTAHHGNFWCYFASKGFVGTIYQKKEHYIRFAQENPELSAELCQKIQNEKKSGDALSESTERLLYKAYVIMKGYGLTDEDLFT
jgi:hypothetical protein